VLIPLAEPTPIAAAIEGAIVPEPVVGAVDGLPRWSPSGAARHDSMMEALIRVITGAAKGGLGMMCRCPRDAQQREHGRDHRDGSTQQPSPRAPSGQRPGQAIE
jgi:hypothetical protein